MNGFGRRFWRSGLWLCVALVAAPAVQAQSVQTIDPNSAIDGDLNGQQYPAPAPTPSGAPYQAPSDPNALPPAYPQYPDSSDPTLSGAYPTTGVPGTLGTPQAAASASTTYERDDLIGAAEGVFGKGAAGLGDLIEQVLKDQGQPNAYIAGREASGAFFVGLRYGSGIISHKVEGQRPVYWTGPSVGFDIGGDAAKVFVLVYNLVDSQELYRRYPAGEGRVYFVGGFSASYLRRGDVVMIPVRLGVGWRLGANIGYMKFSEKQRWLPF